MKRLLLLIAALGAIRCSQPHNNNDVLQQRIDSLDAKLADAYKPGFGEFMSSIQVHHNKLWFAGENQNWELADFEIHEIMEVIEDIQHYQKERKESAMIGVILPALDSVNSAIEQKNYALFKSSFITLTNTCNDCHRTVDFGFNIVKIPSQPPFSNQEFKPQDKQ